MPLFWLHCVLRLKAIPKHCVTVAENVTEVNLTEGARAGPSFITTGSRGRGFLSNKKKIFKAICF